MKRLILTKQLVEKAGCSAPVKILSVKLVSEMTCSVLSLMLNLTQQAMDSTPLKSITDVILENTAIVSSVCLYRTIQLLFSA